jgi:epoxyqueuosine reductase
LARSPLGSAARAASGGARLSREADLPGGILPVNPSTLRDCKDLQKFDPSGYPSGGVSDPSGSRCRASIACEASKRYAEELLKDKVKERARELGFDDCRITTAQQPDSADHFQQWLAKKWHGEMAYLARNAHKRVDPEKVLAAAKSIITLAVSYEWRGTNLEGAEFHKQKCSVPLDTQHSTLGKIARYARFTDYHNVLGERLKLLAEFVNQLGGEQTRSLWYVDSGPFLERDLAQRAGLGFIGKHTNLISRKLGNWIFLSEIITTLEIEPDPPETNHCGRCSRCITACPTQAIRAPFQLDARRCISYLTIELKGSIPVELRPLIGNRIYGCDDCVAVCPWNRFAREGEMMKAHARPELATPDLIELLSLDEAGFKKRFAETPMLRTKRRGLLRNVCVALGNQGDQAALPALHKAAQDAEPLIAEHAQWAVKEIGGRTQRKAIKSLSN